MSVETALFFESLEEIYSRIFRAIRPRTLVPSVTVRFRQYANANSRIRLAEGKLLVDISDLLESAPAPVQEALAIILISKLFRNIPERAILARYRRYLDRAEIRRTLHLVKQTRGRKSIGHPQGKHYDLCAVFEDLNLEYFHGLLARPDLGWSLRPSRSTLGHYDPSHNVIVLTRLLDTPEAGPLIIRYVMFHEMLHLRYPTETRRNGRRCIHTPAFKEAEHLFQGYETAKVELKRFIEQLR